MKALFTQRFDAARAALAEGDEPAAAESLHWAIVAARSDPGLRRELASGLFHLGKLSRKFGRAGEAEAEQLLTEALTISEGLFGVEHAALAPLLNELSRLHLQRSNHSRAEEALERLLAIARLKGEENADVAIALAGLAFAKRKLGDEAAAEALYRDALRIRERVLEPNNMVTVGTLEQLSETCAARGNFSEALALLQRALPTREAALGPGHETVRAVRARITELELQVAIAADAAAVAAARVARGPIPTPVWIKRPQDSPPESPAIAAASGTSSAPAKSNELEFLGEPEPPVRRSAPPLERSKTPAGIAAVAAASLMASPIQMPPAPQNVMSPPETAHPSGTVAGRDSDATYREAVHVDVAHSDFASNAAPVADWQSSVAPAHADAPEPAAKKRTVMYASAGAVALAAAVAIAALVLRPGAGGGSASTAAQPNTSTPGATATKAAGVAATGAAAVVGAARADSVRSATPTTAPSAPAGKAEEHPAETAVPVLKAPRVQVNIGAMNIPSVAASKVDSMVRSATERQQRAQDTDRIGGGGGLRLATSTSESSDDAPTPPKLIGRAPVPRFPDALRAAQPEGQVLVRFKVNEQGNVDVASMVVLKTDHDLFAEAVRDILPRFKFEPGRTRPPESKPVAAWVTVPFKFTAKR